MPSQPTRPGDGARLLMLERARELAEGRATARPRLVYQVSGGPPGKRLERTLEVSPSGGLTLRTHDESAGPPTRVTAKLSRRQVEDLFRQLVDSRLFENVDGGRGFLPDSMIGSIRLEDGTHQFTYFFLADEQQRRQQQKDLNPSLQTMTSVLEAMVQEVSGGGRGGLAQ